MGNYVSRLLPTQSVHERHSEICRSCLDLPSCPVLPIQEPTQSFWTFPPSLIANHSSSDKFPTHADVVIIGSGISAASFARALLDIDQARSDDNEPLQVVMLEAQETCSGATGRNGGHINPPLFHDYEDLRRDLGKTAAQQMIRFRLAHCDVLREVAEVEAEDADCREVCSVDVFFDEAIFTEAKRKLSIFKADMPLEAAPYRVWEGEDARRRYNLSSLAVGCFTTRAGAVQPYRFVTDIILRLLEEYPKYFQLFTHTPCTSISGPSSSNPVYSLTTPRGQLITSHVVHLTNAYVSTLVPGLANIVYGNRETMSAQRPGIALKFQANDAQRSTHESRSYIFYDSPQRKGFDYLTQLPNGEHELMFGGGYEAPPDDTKDRRVCRPPSKGMFDVHSAAHVSGALSIYFGASNWGAEGISATESPKEDSLRAPWSDGRVKALWSGILSVSVDEFPWVGRIPSVISGRQSPAPRATASEKDNRGSTRMADSGEWTAAGYSGEGMVHAWLCARALALMVLGLEAVRGAEVDAEGGYGEGQTVDEWLPASYRISVARWKRAYRKSNGLRKEREMVVRGGTGKMKLYRGI